MKINKPTNEELVKPCFCGSNKILGECCHRRVIRVINEYRKNADALPPRLTSERGYEHWSDLMELERSGQNHGQKQWFGFLNTVDEFFAFWTSQLKIALAWGKKLSKEMPKNNDGANHDRHFRHLKNEKPRR